MFIAAVCVHGLPSCVCSDLGENKCGGMAFRSTVVILQSSQARQPTNNALNICGVITFDLLVYISLTHSECCRMMVNSTP